MIYFADPINAGDALFAFAYNYESGGIFWGKQLLDGKCNRVYQRGLYLCTSIY